MNLKIHKTELSKNLAIVSGAIEKNPPIAALSGIKFELDNEKLVLTASNGDISIQTITTEIGNDNINGSLLIDGKFISDATSKLDGFIELYKDKNSVRIKSDKTNYKLNDFDVSIYPNIDFSYNKDKELLINGNELITVLNRVINSVSTNDTRPILTGVNITAKNNKLEFSSTDSHRMAKAYLNIEKNVDLNVTVLASTLKNVMKIVKDKELYISTDNNKITFRTDNTVIVSRVIDGVYPNTDSFIPKDYNSYIEVDRLALIKSVDRSSLLKENNIWVINITTENEKIVLETTAIEIGQTHETLSAKISGEPITISLNGKYLLTALSALEDERVLLSLVGNLKPLTITDNTDQTQLLLPVRTQ